MSNQPSSSRQNAASRVILVAYDVADRTDTRAALAESLMTIGDAWARPLDTLWMIRTSQTAAEIEADLAPLLGDHDGLMVQETKSEPYFSNTALRWFRPRRRHGDLAIAADNDVVQFPASGVREIGKAA